MKYIKTFNGLNRKKINKDKLYIYTYSIYDDHDYFGENVIISEIIGHIKILKYTTPDIYYMEGYDFINNQIGDRRSIKIEKDNWKGIREASEKEIDILDAFNNANKYNL